MHILLSTAFLQPKVLKNHTPDRLLLTGGCLFVWHGIRPGPLSAGIRRLVSLKPMSPNYRYNISVAKGS